MNLSDRDLNELLLSAEKESDMDDFVAKHASSGMDFEDLCAIWDAAHLSVRDIRKASGLTQAKFAERYHIPLRTLQNWDSGLRKPPLYLVLLLAHRAGMIDF